MGYIFITKDNITGYFKIGHCNGTKNDFFKKYKYLDKETLILFMPHDNIDKLITKIYSKLSNKRLFKSNVADTFRCSFDDIEKIISKEL